MKYKNIVCPGASITSRPLQAVPEAARPLPGPDRCLPAPTDAGQVHKAVSSEEWDLPEGKIYPAESGGQDYGQHKIFEASRHRGRNGASSVFPLPRRRRTAPPKMSSVAPIGQSQPQKMRPANTASRMVNTAGKKSRDNGSGDQRYRCADKGIKPQEKV